MDNGKSAYTYNYLGLESYTIASDETLPSCDAEIKLDYEYDGDSTGKGDVTKIYVNDKIVAQGYVEKYAPAVFSADETADVGKIMQRKL